MTCFNLDVFTCSFYVLKSRKRKKMLVLTVFFALLGSACVKAVRKMLVKLTPSHQCSRDSIGSRYLIIISVRRTSSNRPVCRWWRPHFSQSSLMIMDDHSLFFHQMKHKEKNRNVSLAVNTNCKSKFLFKFVSSTFCGYMT